MDQRAPVLPRDLATLPQYSRHGVKDKTCAPEMSNWESSRTSSRLSSSRLDRVFVTFGKKNPRGFNGIEIGCISRPVAFVKRVTVPDTSHWQGSVRKTRHPNLVNLTDVFVHQKVAYFTYEKPGLSLRELSEMEDVAFDRIAVATICREIIKGLIYLQEELGLSHGELSLDNIYVNEDGVVKIGDIGNSMVRKQDQDDVSRDIQAVYDIASTLLDLQGCDKKETMSFHLAESFTLSPSTVTLREVLTHPFLEIGQGPWYLAYLGLMYTFGFQKSVWFKPSRINHQEDTAESSDGTAQQ